MGLGWSLACGLRLSYPHIGVPASGGNLQCSQGFLIPPSLSPLTCLPEAPISSSSISWPCQSGCRTQSKYLMVLIWAPSPWLPCPGIGTWHSPYSMWGPASRELQELWTVIQSSFWRWGIELHRRDITWPGVWNKSAGTGSSGRPGTIGAASWSVCWNVSSNSKRDLLNLK